MKTKISISRKKIIFFVFFVIFDCGGINQSRKGLLLLLRFFVFCFFVKFLFWEDFLLLSFFSKMAWYFCKFLGWFDGAQACPEGTRVCPEGARECPGTCEWPKKYIYRRFISQRTAENRKSYIKHYVTI